jgi:agmatinase
VFPGADADRDAAEYVLVGAPLDVSTSFLPGARFGPERVRRFARTFEDYDRRTDSHFSALGVHDHGDVRAWNDAAEYLNYLGGVLRNAVDAGAVPLTIGGEHTVSVAGVRAVDPETVVCLDAHLDLRDEYDGDPLSHACAMRRALEIADRLVVLGARTGSRAEYDRAAEADVTSVPPESVPEWTPDDLDGGPGRVHLSVDVDAVDPGFAPGTGTMEPFGLHPRETRRVVRAVAPYAAGFDVVEVNDRDGGQTAALAGKLLRAFVYEHAAEA